MADLSDFFPVETDAVVYARMVGDLPALPAGNVWNTREGSVVHGFLSSYITERRRFVGYTQEALRQTFMLYANDDFLDLRAAEVGVERGPAWAATVALVLTGAEGARVPPGSLFASAGDASTGAVGITFATLTEVYLIGGTATVLASATISGVVTNVGAETITIIVSAPDTVDTVTNPMAAYGGSNREDNEALRARALAAAAAFPQMGNATMYRARALIQPGVGVAQVTDLWNGAGSVQVVIGGTETPFVMPETVDSLQSIFDPSIQVIAHAETPESWLLTNATYDLVTPLEGQESILLSPTTIASAIALYTFPASIDLSRFSSTADELWLYIRRITPSGQTMAFTIAIADDVGAHKDYTYTQTTIDALTSIGTRAFWKIALGNIATTINMKAVKSITVTLASNAVPSQLEIDAFRFRRSAGGILSGQAPIGIQVLVRSARQFEIDITASVVLRAGIGLDDVRASAASALETFLSTIPPGGVVYLADVGNVIHDISGVLDHSNVQINGAISNYSLDSDQRPILGTSQLY